MKSDCVCGGGEREVQGERIGHRARGEGGGREQVYAAITSST